MPDTAIDQTIATHGALAVYQAANFEEGCTDRIMALGLPRPRTLKDVADVNRAAYAALSPAEQAREDKRDRIALDALASACKAGVGPRRPRGLPWGA